MSVDQLSSVLAGETLPITEVLPEIEKQLSLRDELVLEAPPGAGKTTLVPLLLLGQAWREDKKIIVLEPRRLAARNAANRMAQLLGEQCGKTVGYRVRMDSKVGPETVIEVVTEGVFTRMLQSDPTLEDVAVVVFDEFHERSLDADLGLALLKQSKQVYGDLRERPVKTVVMSATLNGSLVSEYLDEAPVVVSKGRMFPVEHRYADPYNIKQDTAARAVQAVRAICAEETGSLLVFLPGRREIGEAARSLRAYFDQNIEDSVNGGTLTARVCELYGDMSIGQQQSAIEPPIKGERKIVLATNIAESSLTIEGVRIVIDSGLQREARYDPNTGMTRLHLCRISKASAEQRGGRAGRLCEGICIRLWSREQHNELAPFSSPEIQQADMVPLALQLLKWGETDIQSIPWLDTPSIARYEQALDLLQELNAIQRSGAITLTPLGEVMALLPVHPRLAYMLIVAKQMNALDDGCRLAALLGERDIGDRAMGVDLSRRLALLGSPKTAPRHIQPSLQRVLEVARRLRSTLNGVNLAEGVGADLRGVAALALDSAQLNALLLAAAFPDRIAHRKPHASTEYLLANGRAVKLFEDDLLAGQDWLVVAEASGQQGRSVDIIRLALASDFGVVEAIFKERLSESAVCYWDDKQDRVVSEKRRALGAIVLSQKVNHDVDPEQKRLAVKAFVLQKGLSALHWSSNTKSLRARVQLMASLETESGAWPDWTDAGLVAELDTWLMPFLTGVNNLAELHKVCIQTGLLSMLSWEQQTQLAVNVPETYKAPSGRDVAIDYSVNPPVIAVKLQEMFGAAITPAVGNGRVSLLIHLLSPAGRPLQVTQDLAGFWRGAYSDVKKEMKGRYPKHPWPDDPVAAIATRKTKSQLNR